MCYYYFLLRPLREVLALKTLLATFELKHALHLCSVRPRGRSTDELAYMCVHLSRVSYVSAHHTYTS